MLMGDLAGGKSLLGLRLLAVLSGVPAWLGGAGVPAPGAPTPTGCSRCSAACAPQTTRSMDCSSWEARRPYAKEPGQSLPWAQGPPRMRTPTLPEAEAELAEEGTGAAPGAQLTGLSAQAVQHGLAGPRCGDFNSL